MRRYWIPESCLGPEHVVLKGDLFHHICVVCRQGLGDRFEVICQQKAFFVEIESVAKKTAVAVILETREIPPLPKPHIHLALSLPKFATLDRTIEKMVELGVATVHLFSSDYSFKKPRPSDLEKKHSRWQKIIQGATQQTGRGEIMELTEIQPLSVLLEENFPSAERLGLLAYEGQGVESLDQVLKNKGDWPSEIWIFVGSEGGFSQKDLELISNYKVLPMTLGDQVLRVETACVTIVSILKYVIGHY